MTTPDGFMVRDVRPDDFEALGELTVAAYAPMGSAAAPPGYHERLRDISARLAASPVLVVVDAEGVVVAGCNYIPDRTCELCEHDVEGAASIRMLAVHPDVRGRGVAERLVNSCLDRARSEGMEEVVVHSPTPMAAARRLWVRLGFVSDPALDEHPAADVHLHAYRLALHPASGC